MKSSVLCGVFAAMCFALLAVPANAQATRTWVSGVGDDANPCSRTAPCKTFAGAISKTAAAGEINVLDPGGFGAVTITKAITIRSDHTEAGVLVSGTNGIVVAAGPNDSVVLEGLDFEGLGTGLNGVNIISGQKVYIIRCSIRRFTQNGVNMTSNTANAEVYIKDSLIYLNGTATGNPPFGGVNISGNGVGNAAAILNTTIDSNVNFGVQVNGAGNTVAAANSVFSGTAVSLSLINGATTAISFGPSNVLSGTGTFTTTRPFQ
jgi:hypothetical protein